MTATAANFWRYTAVGIGLALAAFCAMHPVLGAGFVQDDWVFLAISQHLPDPSAFYLADNSPVHFYRPHGLLSWWLLTRAFGLDAPAHYALQIALHASGGLALFWLLRRQGHGNGIAWGGALVFVLHPATVSTASWLSDRFDLMATLGVLVALAVASGPRPGRPAALAALAMAALLAVGSKETGVLAGPLVALLMLARSELPWRERARVVLVAGSPTLAWAGLRIFRLGTDIGRPPGSSLLADAAAGMADWLFWLPRAMALDLGTVGAMLAVAAVALATVVGLRKDQDGSRRRVALGLGLLLSPALVQWPATLDALSIDDPLAHTANLRFFHLACAGFALLLAQLAQAGARRLRRQTPAFLALPLLAIAALFPAAHGRSAGLAALTSDPAQRQIEASLARSFHELAQGPGCKLWYPLPATVNLPGFADHIAKAGLPRGHRALDSLVVTDPMPWHALLSAAGATPAALAPLKSRQLPGGGDIGLRAIGPLYLFYPEALPADAPPNRLCPPEWLEWNGTAFTPAA